MNSIGRRFTGLLMAAVVAMVTLFAVAASAADPNARDTGWRPVRGLAESSERNHTYARRPVDAHPGCYALWADGDTLEPSEFGLYFATHDGDAVYRLPRKMNHEWQTRERVAVP